MEYDIIGYCGMACILAASILQRRNLHLLRITGAALWLVYGLAIMSYPILIGNAAAIIFDIIGLIRYGKKETCGERYDSVEMRQMP